MGRMYPVGGGGNQHHAEHDAGAPGVADELTGLAAAASHAAATEVHTRTQHQQLTHQHQQQLTHQHQLAQQHQLIRQHQLTMSLAQQAAQLDSRTKELIHANLPVAGSLMGVPGVPGGKPEVEPDQPPSKMRKRRQSQARLTQNAEAQKRYRYVLTPSSCLSAAAASSSDVQSCTVHSRSSDCCCRHSE